MSSLAYSTLLFDIDDTILNFDLSEKQALNKLFANLNKPLTPEIMAYYQQLNQHLWQQYERGEISRQELLDTRFTLLFKHFGEDLNGKLIEKTYRNYLAEGHDPIPGAKQLVTTLGNQHELYLVTNGIANTQERRIREAGLAPYFENLFISERIGARKPEKAFFDYVAQHIPNFDRHQSLVIGDSLTSDILGARTYGLDSVWFNPQHQSNQTTTKPTYEIDQLAALKKIV